MGATKYELEVWLDGQEDPIEVVADQRDVAMFEREEKIGFVKALDDMPTLFVRALAWFAMKRTGKIEPGTKRKDWEERLLDAQFAGEDEPDPTQPGVSDETS
jgi:hypothetical protein